MNSYKIPFTFYCPYNASPTTSLETGYDFDLCGSKSVHYYWQNRN